MDNGEKNYQTEEATVVIVDGLRGNITDEQLSRCGTPDVAHMDVVPSKKVNEHGVNGDAVVISDATEMDRNGQKPQHITKDGVKQVVSTKTTKQQEAEEVAEKKRIAEMPSPVDDNDVKVDNQGEER